MVPLVLGRPVTVPQVAVSESPFFGRQRVVTLGDRRMLFTKKTGAAELYDYRADPLEQIDVAERHPSEIEVRRRLLESWETMVSSSSVEGAAPKQPLDEETIKQLRELGYVR